VFGDIDLPGRDRTGRAGMTAKPVRTEDRGSASRLCVCRLSLLASAAEEEPEEQAAGCGRGDDHDVILQRETMRLLVISRVC